ncbi:MAG: hypothetical protein AAFN93_11715 [Bacteroidota bacterium]
MKQAQDPFAHIAEQLETKSVVKQEAYRNLCLTFKAMETRATAIVERINNEIKDKDQDISISVTKENDREFHIKVAGDLLVFIMHTNIIVLDREHGASKSKHVEENPMRKYFGQINVYNFMADSIKFNRLNDPGYLLARVLINCQDHFLVEGDGQLNFMFEKISSNPISETDIDILIQLIISQAIDSDLTSPPFPKIRTITLNQKIHKTEALGAGTKIGFQMSYQQKVD